MYVRLCVYSAGEGMHVPANEVERWLVPPFP